MGVNSRMSRTTISRPLFSAATLAAANANWRLRGWLVFESVGEGVLEFKADYKSVRRNIKTSQYSNATTVFCQSAEDRKIRTQHSLLPFGLPIADFFGHCVLLVF